MVRHLHEGSQPTSKLTQYVLSGCNKNEEDDFERRRHAIITQCQEREDYEADEDSNYDFESLKQLSLMISALLKWEPESRVSAQQALSYIEWVDYRSGA